MRTPVIRFEYELSLGRAPRAISTSPASDPLALALPLECQQNQRNTKGRQP
jgi:hypothetical protein